MRTKPRGEKTAAHFVENVYENTLRYHIYMYHHCMYMQCDMVLNYLHGHIICIRSHAPTYGFMCCWVWKWKRKWVLRIFDDSGFYGKFAWFAGFWLGVVVTGYGRWMWLLLLFQSVRMLEPVREGWGFGKLEGNWMMWCCGVLRIVARVDGNGGVC